LLLGLNEQVTTELSPCEADTTSDYYSVSGGSTPLSHSRSQSIALSNGWDFHSCIEEDGDSFPYSPDTKDDEWEQLDRQLQLLEERRGSVSLPQSSSWHK